VRVLQLVQSVFMGAVLICARPAIGTSRKWTPIQLGIIAPIQLFSPRHSVYGVRLCIVGSDNPKVVGIDMRLPTNITRGRSGGPELIGVQVGGVNCSMDYVYGCQLGVVNVGSMDFGAQGGVVNWLDIAAGIEFGIVNVQFVAVGLQSGVLNFEDSFGGIQLGAINMVSKAYGVQLGGINSVSQDCRALLRGNSEPRRRYVGY